MKLFKTALMAASMSLAFACAAMAADVPKHVILIMMENHGTDTLVGNKDDAPYINTLIGEKGVSLATQYYGVTHPSLPNYLALVSGDTQGIYDDCKAGTDVKCKPEEFVGDTEEAPMKGALMTDDQAKKAAETAHIFAGQTIIDQLDAAGKSWKIHMQGIDPAKPLDEYAPMGADGKPVAKLYAQKHNPFVYFTAFHDDAKKVAKVQDYDAFAADLKSGQLADFTFVVPDQCHDMHGLSEGGAAAIKAPDCAYPKSGLDHSVIKLGDAYLKDTVAAIKASPAWGEGTAILFVWDEDDYAGAAGLRTSPTGRNGAVLGGSRTPMIVVTGNDRPARVIDAPYNHYNLLATLEAAYGLPCLGHACEVKDAVIPDLFK